MEVAREVLRARDLLIDLEKVALHPAFKEEWRVVSDLNVRIVEALKLKQPVLVVLFIARRLGEAAASEKAGAIRTAHAPLKELKAMGGKGGFAELAKWVIPPPGHGSVWGAPQGPAHTPHHASGGFGGGGLAMAPMTSAAHTWEGLTVAGEGTPAAGWGTTAPQTGGSIEDAGGGVAAEAAGAAAAERMLYVRQVGPRPSVLSKLRTHSRDQLYVAGAPIARSSVARYVRRPDTRLCTGREHKHVGTTVRYKRGLRRGGRLARYKRCRSGDASTFSLFREPRRHVLCVHIAWFDFGTETPAGPF